MLSGLYERLSARPFRPVRRVLSEEHGFDLLPFDTQ